MDFDTIAPTLKKPIMIAMSKGIITGYEDYTFKASNLANRAQAATIIARVIDVNKRKQVNYFEDQKKILVNKSTALKGRMDNHNKSMDEAIDYLLGYSYDLKPFESKEDIRFLFLKKLQDFETKLGQQIPIVYGEKQSLTIELEGKTCEISTAENYFRAKWFLSGSLTLFYEKGIDGSGYFIRDTLKNRDFGFNYNLLNDELRIDSTIQDTFLGAAYYVYKLDGKYVSQIKEIDINSWESVETNSLDRFVIYYGDFMGYYDYNEKVTVFIEPDNSSQIYVYEDIIKGDGIGFIQDNSNYTFIGDVKGFKFIGAGYAMQSDGTAFIGEYEGQLLKGKATMFCTNGLILEDTFQSYVAYSIHDSNYYSQNPDATSIEKEIDTIISNQITVSMTTDEKIRAIHDYLVLNITYDTGNVDNTLEYFNINNAYAGIVNRSTICLGYAQSMNLILNRMGIESYVVIGDTDSNKISDHAWNYVRFSDGFYHVDVTWDDIDVGTQIYYDYFKVHDNIMRGSRGIEKIMGYED